MRALITGASAGLGAEFARQLSKMGYDLILVARREDRLKELSAELDTKTEIITMDLSLEENCFKLFESLENTKIDLLINNAGFGLFGNFTETDLDKEMNMIDLNIKSLHILTKLFLKKFKEADCGRILNVASSAAFLSGPLMATYYATKAYVLRLTDAISEELRRDKSKVYIGALCPGPVDTEFSAVAGVNFALAGIKADYCVRYALKKMFKGKKIIIPGVIVRTGVFFQRFLPYSILRRISFNIQRKKG